MAKRRKTWAEKLADDKDLPKVLRLDAAAARRGGKLLVKDVDRVRARL